jgi:hypothetical protein
MQAVSSGYNEYRTSQEEKRLRQEYFGDSTVVVYQGHPNYALYDHEVSKLVAGIPPANNGSRFVESYVTLIPKICVVLKDLQPLFAGRAEGSLLLTQVGRATMVSALKHPLIGAITCAERALVIKNIRFLPQAAVKSNTDLPATYNETNSIHINANTRYGYYDPNPHLVKTTVIADIVFGDYVRNEMVLEVTSTGDETSAQFSIPLEPERIKILQDGSLHRKNGDHFNISQISKNKTLRWVNFEWSVNIPFQVII